MEKLNNYEWPGNIRQLEHEIERATILARGGEAAQYGELRVAPDGELLLTGLRGSDLEPL